MADVNHSHGWDYLLLFGFTVLMSVLIAGMALQKVPSDRELDYLKSCFSQPTYADAQRCAAASSELP